MPEDKFRFRLRSFFHELRRRKVIRAMVAYLVVGAGIAEGATIFLPPLGVPVWVPNMVAILVVLGFPVAMVLAWMFDIVPDPKEEGEGEAQASDAGTAGSADPASSRFLSAIWSKILTNRSNGPSRGRCPP